MPETEVPPLGLSSRISSAPGTDPNSQLFREVESLKELMTKDINAIRESIRVAHADLVRFPTELESKIYSLKELFDTKLQALKEVRATDHRAIREHFELIEKIRVEQKADTQLKVDDALKAVKESTAEQNKNFLAATTKSETSTTKQIDQQGQNTASITEGLNKEIGNLKERLTGIEQRSSGRGDVWGYIIGGVGLIIALVALADRFGSK